MTTLKLKKPGTAAKPAEYRAPLRGSGAKTRPTLAEAQAQRAEREARYQEQLRQRFGDRPPTTTPSRDADARRSAPKSGGNPDSGRRKQRDGRESGADRAAPRPTPRSTDRDRREGRATGGERTVARPIPRSTDPDRRESRATGGERTAPRPIPRGTDRGADRHVEPWFADAKPRTARDAGPRAEHRGERHDLRETEPASHAPGSLRLSKRISELGIASRREADEWIAKGWVRVDGRIVSELGSRVLPEQHITVDAKARFQQAQRVTVLLNKPVGFVSGQAEDGYEPALVLVTPERQWRDDRSGTRFLCEHLRSLVPAGRLDIDSVGLLVLTQDGRIAKQLIGEDSEVEKEYLVRVALPSGGKLPEQSLALLNHGLELDGEPLRPAQVEWVNEDQLRFVLRQGKKRQIRRMCEAVGLQVLGLKRVRIGQVMLGDLPAGQWRYLRADESF